MTDDQTTWFNPTDKPIKVKLLTNEARWMEVTFPPKAEVKLRREYDAAIKRPTDGACLGLAPALLNITAGEVPPVEETKVDPKSDDSKTPRKGEK